MNQLVQFLGEAFSSLGLAIRGIVNPPGWRVGNSQGMITLTAATTDALFHNVPPGRVARIVKVILTNSGGTQSRVQFGDTDDGTITGVWTQRLADITVAAGGTEILSEHDIPRVFERFRAGNNIMVQMSAATTSMFVSGEVEETDG